MRTRWCICGRAIREDDDVCSPECERELERRAEAAGEREAFLLSLPEAWAV